MRKSNLATRVIVAVSFLLSTSAIGVACGDGSGDVPADTPDGSGGDGSITAAGDGSTTTLDSGTSIPPGDANNFGDSVLLGDSPGTPGADGGTVTDGGPGTGTPTTIPCGAATCATGSQVCCVYADNNSFNFSCVGGTTCPEVNNNEGVALGCTTSAGCTAGNVCCITDGNSISATCVAENDCDPDDDEFVLCDPANPTCPGGDTCSSNNIADWDLPNGFGLCEN